MVSNLINPETGKPITDNAEFKRLARTAAGLPAYDMDDPERPFTPEYDESLRGLPQDASTQPDVAEPAKSGGHSTVESLVARAERMAATVREADEKAIDAARYEREDPYESLGGGLRTLRIEGYIPIGNREDILEATTHGRGGKLVTRLILNGRFRDVPIHEGTPHGAELERAKDELIKGHGTSVSRLHRKAR